MKPSLWRAAVGSCLLAAGLMVSSGGALALADTGSDAGSAAGDSAPGTGTSPGPNLGVGALRSTLRGVATSLGVGPLRSPQSSLGGAGSTGSTGSTRTPNLLDPFAATAHITRTVTGILGPRLTPTTPAQDSTALPTVVAPETSGAAADTAPSIPALPVIGTSVVPPSFVPPNFVPPVPDVSAAASTAVTAVQNVVAPIAEQVAAVPNVIANDVVVPALRAPISDVLGTIQQVLTSTNAAIEPLVQLPSDFASLMTYPVSQQPTGVNTDGGMSGAPMATAPAPLQIVGAMTGGASAGSTAGAIPTPPHIATTMDSTTAALAKASSEIAEARVDDGGAFPEAVQRFLNGYGGVIVAASLSALLAAALPGILGFGIPTVAGIRIGYRQAKAGTSLRASDISRFAVGGPIGIVRSGSLVAVRSQAPGPGRTSARSRGHLQQVA